MYKKQPFYMTNLMKLWCSTIFVPQHKQTHAEIQNVFGREKGSSKVHLQHAIECYEACDILLLIKHVQGKQHL